MLQIICRKYGVLPELRTMTVDEIVFFYNGIREELVELTKPRPKK